MSTQHTSDQPTVYHGPSLEVDISDLDEIGYSIVQVTAENAERLGYQPDDAGFKLRRTRNHIADVGGLADGLRVVAGRLATSLCLIEEPGGSDPYWVVALRDPEDSRD